MPKSTLKAKLSDSYDAFLIRLIQAREEAGLSQREASRLLGRAKTYVNKCETKERRVDIIELMEFAEIYNKKIEYYVQDFKPQYKKN